MHAVIYVRVSTEEQATEGYSLAAQERACREEARQRGWKILQVYADEGVSGRSEQRPALQRLLNDARSTGRPPFRAVIIHNLDRFARNLRLQLNLKAEFDAAGIQIVSVLDSIDTSTPEGVLHFQMKGMLSEWFSNNLAREVRKGLKEKVERGLWIGPVPFGYRMADDGILVPDDNAPVVQETYRLYASGQYSYITLADELNVRGYRITGKGGIRHIFSKENARDILNNVAYIGLVKFKKLTYPGQHEPLIDQRMWVTTSTIIRQRGEKCGRISIGSAALGGLLTELVFCAQCGQRMWHHWSGKRRTNPPRYYVCSGRARRTCDIGFIRASEVENAVVTMFHSLVIPRDVQQAIIERAELIIKSTQDSQPVINQAKLKQRLERLRELYLDGELDRDRYDEERQPIIEQLASADTPKHHQVLDLEHAIRRLETVGQLITTGTLGERREVVRSVLRQIWIEPHRVVAIAPSGAYTPLIEAARLNLVGRVGFEPTTS